MQNDSELNIYNTADSSGIDMTVAQDAEMGEYAHKIHTELVKTQQEINFSFLTLARLLHEVSTKQLWKQLDYNSMEEYIRSPELAIDHSWSYLLIRVYNKFVLTLNQPERELLKVGVSKLGVLSKTNLVDEDNVEDWLAKAEALSKVDLITEVKNAEGGPPQKEYDVDALEGKNALPPGFYHITKLEDKYATDFVEIGKVDVIVGTSGGAMKIIKVK